MNDKFRYLLAGLLIFLIILLQPTYLKWLGYDAKKPEKKHLIKTKTFNQEKETFQNLNNNKKNVDHAVSNNTKESTITIISPLYTATISNRSGGSFNKYILTDTKKNRYKHSGGYDFNGDYFKEIPVSLILPNDFNCQPCLGSFFEGEYDLLNMPFSLITPQTKDTIIMQAGESLSLDYILYNQDGLELIKKRTSFFSDNYLTNHTYYINETNLNHMSNIELLWLGGLRPTEEKISEDTQYSSAIISQSREMEDIQVNDPDKIIKRTIYNGNTEWVAIRTKYFISSLIAKNDNSFATLSAKNIQFGNRKHTPVYSSSIGYSLEQSEIQADLYLGPLDIDYVLKTNSSLDSSMNWGWAIIRPISKSILWFLKFLHGTLKLNYGFALLLFAVLIRLITGPLTKKSYESTQKMQKIQPQIKKIQEKFKQDPQKLNKEMMGIYKKYGVNPLGGCLPMLLQMPLLMALFIVFRTTIEFRGEPFILWITDLSKPDIVFSLPFNIPIYGDGIAILPLLMGTTLFLTMKMSSATMDSSQKPIMYIMNGFFILLFNSFPSGLNLYYTAYNLLSFFQQQGIRKKLADS